MTDIHQTINNENDAAEDMNSHNNRVDFFKSQRGGDMIYYDKYVFNIDGKKSVKGSRWRCKNRSCNAYIFLDNMSMIVKHCLDHNHVNHEQYSAGQKCSNDAKITIIASLSPIESALII